uniref:Cell division control protein 73 C-terminal domain-containing protein n=1 Tax=Heterosigma akashiwo TaxID=2829 RepID=A0A7S3Y6H8_HETAK|mmetsp:Transcript_21382/g.35379  ORF Transcript_21382/g.35379 Transcript_21382/m.35379 type:complete len:163 (-) Transcript_21382:322-810(-)
MMSLFNAKEFMQDGSFVPSQEKRRAGAAKPARVVVERARPPGAPGEGNWTFEVVDNAARLKPRDWDRVVAVVVQGAAWQFKGWKYPQPLDLFNRYLGIYFQYEDEKIAAAVQQWNVKTLRINKHKRHLDQVAQNEFWRITNEWLSVHRPNFQAKPLNSANNN